MNRAPSKNDRWFGKMFLLFLFKFLYLNQDEHERRCNGQFIKVKGSSNEKKNKEQY